MRIVSLAFTLVIFYLLILPMLNKVVSIFTEVAEVLS